MNNSRFLHTGLPQISVDTQRTSPVPTAGQPSGPGVEVRGGNELRPYGRDKSGSYSRWRNPWVIIGSGTGLVVVCGILVFLWIAARAVPSVTLYQVSTQNVTQYVGGGGIVFPRQQLDLSYPVAERVVSVLVKAGDHVTPNQPLLQLDPSQLNAQISQAASDLAAAQAYLNTVSTSGNALAIAQAQQAYNLAKNKYNTLVAEASSSLLHNGNLISPLRGVVTTVDINPGEVFAADTPLLTIMDESTVIVHVKVPLANLGQVHTGEAAIVTPSALPDESFRGTVSSIIPQADPQTDTFEVWVNVVNTDGALLPGMSTFVRIQNPTRAMIVPRLAVLNPDSASIVFVEQNGHAYVRQVHVAGRSANLIYIDAGLSPGEVVVLVGLNTLRDGQAVHVTRIEKHS